jgi:glycosyltransferase involved in cell wall biosynthesis
MINPPKISVIISTYNNARYVDKKIKEILQQTQFHDSEFIFIETASPERERDLLTPFCEEHENCRLLTYDERKTLYEAWNIGWEAANSDLVCYSNMDDCMHHLLLEKTVDFFSRYPSTEICSPLIACQKEDDTRNRFDIEAMRGRKLSIRPGPFTAWKKNIDQKIGRFDENFFAAGDKDFWARAHAKRLKIRILWKVLYLFTESPTQLSKNPNQKLMADKALRKNRSYQFIWPPKYKRSVQLLQLVWKKVPRLFLTNE